MESINKNEYDALIANTTVIEKDGYGLKVLETNDGKMIKIFRRKRLLSSATFKPYAVRFVNNAQKLHQLGIPTIDIEKLLRCPEIKRHIVIYKKLPGQLLRDAFSNHQNPKNLFALFGEFVARLHRNGVYFRSMHFNNVLLLEDGTLGLIDISDMQIKRKNLSLKLCLRNFPHMLRYQQDKDLLAANFGTFKDAYVLEAKFKSADKARIEQTLSSLILGPS